MMWYEYDINERIENVYSKFKLKEFWDWWTDNDAHEYMELRIKDTKRMIAYAKKNRVSYSWSGVFVNSYKQLRDVVRHFRGSSVMWFGVNPRRKLPDKNGRMMFSGKDINISSIKFLFIDIDRKSKQGAADKTDLMNADFLANKVIEQMSKAGFDSNYMKLCSGNGVQLVFKLDVPIQMPYPDYLKDAGSYVEDSMFKRLKDTIRTGIGSVLTSFSKKFEDDYNVEIDKTCFNMNRVGAVPTTYNFKHDQMIPRGIIDLKTGVNEGLSDYITRLRDSKEFKDTEKTRIDTDKKVVFSEEYKVLKNELDKNVIIKLMLNNLFPDGGINNTLWYSIKLLLHANAVTKNDDAYVKTHQTLKSLHDRGFSDNGLEPQFKNNYDGPFKDGDVNKVPFIVNKYLRLHKVKELKTGNSYYHEPLFPLSPFGKTRHELVLDVHGCAKEEYSDKGVELSNDYNDPLDDIKDFKKRLKPVRRGDYLDEAHVIKPYYHTTIGYTLVISRMNEMFSDFMRRYRRKWGNEIADYMKKYYMYEILNYRRW